MAIFHFIFLLCISCNFQPLQLRDKDRQRPHFFLHSIHSHLVMKDDFVLNKYCHQIFEYKLLLRGRVCLTFNSIKGHKSKKICKLSSLTMINHTHDFSAFIIIELKLLASFFRSPHTYLLQCVLTCASITTEGNQSSSPFPRLLPT